MTYQARYGLDYIEEGTALGRTYHMSSLNFAGRRPMKQLPTRNQFQQENHSFTRIYNFVQRDNVWVPQTC